MRLAISRALVACTLATAPWAPLAAQRPSLHAGVTWSSTTLQAPARRWNDEPVVMPSVVAGWRAPGGVMLALRASRVRAEAYEARAAMDGGALWISTEATIAEASLGWSPARWALGPGEPWLSIGVLAARVRDGLSSDTPAEYVERTLPGVTAAAGVDLAVAGPVAVRAQATWRALRDDGERRLAYGLDGAALGVGLLLRR